jgi:hypothetical protein
MWILKTYKDLLANLKAQNFPKKVSKRTTFLPFTLPIPMKNHNLDFLVSLITVSLTIMGTERKYSELVIKNTTFLFHAQVLRS